MRTTRADVGALLMAAAAAVYALWLAVLYSRERYDTPCGSLLGPRSGYFGWDTVGTCGVTHWLTAGLAVASGLFAGALMTARRSVLAVRVVLAMALALEVGALVVVAFVAHVYPEPVLGEAWTSARDMLAATVAIQAIATVAVVGQQQAFTN